MTVSRTAGSALCLALFWAAAPLGSQAQTYETGGIQLSFGLALRLEAEDNRGLTTVSTGNSLGLEIPLSFNLLSETPQSRFSFDANLLTRARSDPGSRGDGVDFLNPRVGVAYDTATAYARFSLSAILQETDLTSSDPLVLDDLDLIEGTGTQRRTAIEARVNWRDDAPLGFGALARVEQTSYRGGTATGLDGDRLNDSRRTTFGLTSRLDVNPVTQVNLALTYSVFDEETVADTSEQVDFDANVVLERPLGNISASFRVTHDEDGERLNLNVGRSLAFPLGVLTGRIGVTRTIGGRVLVTGALDVNRELPRGALNFGLSRSVGTSDTQDAEQINTAFNLGYAHNLTPLSAVRFNVDWDRTEDTGTGLSTTNASLGAVYSRELTGDWTMNTGYRHRYRERDVSGTARSNAVFLELRRGFVTRF